MFTMLQLIFPILEKSYLRGGLQQAGGRHVTAIEINSAPTCAGGPWYRATSLTAAVSSSREGAGGSDWVASYFFLKVLTCFDTRIHPNLSAGTDSSAM